MREIDIAKILGKVDAIISDAVLSKISKDLIKEGREISKEEAKSRLAPAVEDMVKKTKEDFSSVFKSKDAKDGYVNCLQETLRSFGYEV